MTNKTSVAAQEAPSLPAEVRSPTGQFVKGASGNPMGRPAGRKSQITVLKQEMELAIRRHVKPDKLKKIVEKVANKAANGNIPAAKLIFDHFLSKATTDEDAQDRPVIRVVIDNMTHAAAQGADIPVKATAVDAEFTEVITE